MERINTLKNDLIQEALNAGQNSYSPYSNFKVGAAVECKNGKIYKGTNVENSSYGLTICAERNALAAAIVAGERDFTKIVVSSKNGVAPCGACRQVIWDICGDINVILTNNSGTITKEMRSSELLPAAFGPEDLKK
ncbi:MAG: cytidine deaminase [Candidatus Marinimicrobia bacterium]|nr:cytidine deaminase [Candidatus Neomarinimicrobiota bacterium]